MAGHPIIVNGEAWTCSILLGCCRQCSRKQNEAKHIGVGTSLSDYVCRLSTCLVQDEFPSCLNLFDLEGDVSNSLKASACGTSLFRRLQSHRHLWLQTCICPHLHSTKVFIKSRREDTEVPCVASCCFTCLALPRQKEDKSTFYRIVTESARSLPAKLTLLRLRTELRLFFWAYLAL